MNWFYVAFTGFYLIAFLLWVRLLFKRAIPDNDKIEMPDAELLHEEPKEAKAQQ